MSIRTMVAQPLEATPHSASYVTIQMRRGLESQMDKSKFLPAEFGATTDTKKLFFAFGAGDVQQLATYQNLEGLMAQALAGLEEEYLGSITQATQNAINATSQASSAATAANQAADEANEIIDAFKEAVDGTIISDELVSETTTYSSKKIEEMAQTNLLPEYIIKFPTISNVDFEYTDGKIKITANTSNKTQNIVYDLTNLNKDTDYSISWKSSRSGNSGGGIAVSNGEPPYEIIVSKWNTLNGNITFNTQQYNKIRILLYIAPASSAADIGEYAEFEKIMLVEGKNSPVFIKNSFDISKEIAEIKNANFGITFQQAAERANIQSGDTLAVAFGKLAKFCADMQDYVFSAPVASLASTDATRPLAASMGKRLNDDFTAKFESLNSALESYYGSNYTGSINSLRTPGIYWCDFSQVTGAIWDEGYGWVEVIKAFKTGESCIQKIYRYADSGVVVIAYRCYTNNKWYPTRLLNTSPIS